MTDEDITDISDAEIMGAISFEPDDTDDIVGEMTDPDELRLGDEEEIGAWGFFRSIARSISHAVKSIAHSNFVKMVAGGAAIVFPPVGVPATVALVAADRMLQVADGKKGTPRQQAVMKKAIAHTVTLAKAGDPDAKRAEEFMLLARQIRVKTKGHPIGPPTLSAAHKKAAIVAPLVHPDGRIERGSWLRV